jgi:hypothetical protein
MHSEYSVKLKPSKKSGILKKKTNPANSKNPR